MSTQELVVADIMSSGVVSTTPDATVYEAARLMKEKNVGSLVVLDGQGNLVGIITVSDIVFRVVAEGLDPAKTKVGDVMSKNPYYVLDNEPAERAVEIMGSAGVGHLPVLDHVTFKVVGVVSKRDILREAPHLLGRLSSALKV
ncbi:CBS domain-containing protein [Stetteria hydrogenophila]